jgi:hypothetical protein
MRRTPLFITGLAVAALLAACDPTTAVPPAVGGPAAGACLVSSTDCNDTGVSPEDATTAARSFLGLRRSELPVEVRVARVGDEHYPMTEDYVVGRTTVELDPDAAGEPRVVKVVIELEEGPITVTA